MFIGETIHSQVRGFRSYTESVFWVSGFKVFLIGFRRFCFQLSLLNVGSIGGFCGFLWVFVGLCWDMGEMWEVCLKSCFFRR